MSNAREKLTAIIEDTDYTMSYQLADAIIAALPGMVKPLEWVRHPIGWNCEGFMIDARSFNAIYMMRGMHGKPRFDTVEDAKAAAQRQHVAQVMATLGIDAAAMKEGKDDGSL
ncbi:hypothetical protein [Sulfitobacter sp. 1A13679]|uniref:hypothetical protein n=1 Tax=Sulfitobacter sp. 1A13679 TaxID=3368597 RepID=UPI003745687E